MKDRQLAEILIDEDEIRAWAEGLPLHLLASLPPSQPPPTARTRLTIPHTVKPLEMLKTRSSKAVMIPTIKPF